MDSYNKYETAYTDLVPGDITDALLVNDLPDGGGN